MEERTAEQVVKEKWSSARPKMDWPGKWTIRRFQLHKGDIVIGEGVSYESAWLDAAQRIRAEGAKRNG